MFFACVLGNSYVLSHYNLYGGKLEIYLFKIVQNVKFYMNGLPSLISCNDPAQNDHRRSSMFQSSCVIWCGWKQALTTADLQSDYQLKTPSMILLINSPIPLCFASCLELTKCFEVNQVAVFFTLFELPLSGGADFCQITFWTAFFCGSV